jgi:predicted  nucleic acid-binding Zn-ribbon protein
MQSTGEASQVLTLKLPMLEIEISDLRQRLQEADADRNQLRQEMDDLRQDRDHWRKLAEQQQARPTTPETDRRAWFCGRVSSKA